MPPPHSWPTLPTGTLQISLSWQIPQPLPALPCAPTTLFHFLARTPLPPGYVPTAAMDTACKFWINTVLGNTLPSATQFVNGYYILEDTPVPHVHPYQYVPFATSGSDHIVQQYCSSFTRRTGIAGRNNIGRCSFVPVVKGYITSNRYNAFAIAALQNVAASMMFTITFDGITYDPALFSRQLFTTTPLTSVELNTLPSRIRRRSQFKNHAVLPWQYIFSP